MKNLSHDELIIINEALLDKVKSLQKDLSKVEQKQEVESCALSLMVYFVADNHPQLTDDFVNFIREKSQDEYLFDDKLLKNKACIEAILYHRDTFNHNGINELYKELMVENQALESGGE